MKKVKLLNLKGEELKDINLKDEIFGLYLIFNWRFPSYKKASSKSATTIFDSILSERSP